jgi:heme/copper-type cytochrome/quinol oxidase subunit 1
VLIGGAVFPLLGAVYYWYPKLTGRMLSDRLGRWNFWLFFLGFNTVFFPLHILGLRGMPRRVYTYPQGLGWDTLNQVETIGAYVFAFGVLLFVANVAWSLRRGAVAGDNPWHASTLEWSVSSPPPAYNFAVIPIVRSRDPLWDKVDVAAEDDASEATTADRILDERKEALGTSVLDAEANRRLLMPADTLYPILLAVAFTALFTGLLLKSPTLGFGGVLATLGVTAGWIWPHGEFPEAAT